MIKLNELSIYSTELLSPLQLFTVWKQSQLSEKQVGLESLTALTSQWKAGFVATEWNKKLSVSQTASSCLLEKLQYHWKQWQSCTGSGKFPGAAEHANCFSSHSKPIYQATTSSYGVQEMWNALGAGGCHMKNVKCTTPSAWGNTFFG